MTVRKLMSVISVSAPYGSGPRMIRFTVEDKSSGCEVMEFDMTPADFGMLLIGNGTIQQEVTWRTDMLGKKHEHKSIDLDYDLVSKVVDRSLSDQNKERHLSAEDRVLLLGEHEVDGWVARERDVFNWQNRKPGEEGWVQRVTMNRWVDVETGDSVSE